MLFSLRYWETEWWWYSHLHKGCRADLLSCCHHFGHASPVTLAFWGPTRFGAGTVKLVSLKGVCGCHMFWMVMMLGTDSFYAVMMKLLESKGSLKNPQGEDTTSEPHPAWELCFRPFVSVTTEKFSIMDTWECNTFPVFSLLINSLVSKV